MIVLDTNVISELMKTQGSPTVYEWVSKQPQMSLFTTTITEAEFYTVLQYFQRGNGETYSQRQLIKCLQKTLSQQCYHLMPLLLLLSLKLLQNEDA
jgi:predicted nucleic acid-binding protein